MTPCSCCGDKYVYGGSPCGCSAASCPTCLLCERHCTCPAATAPALFRYDLAGKVDVVDAVSQRVNFPYDTGPVADTPIIVTD